MHFRISCATILVIFLPLKRFCNASTYNRTTHNQLSARVDSQINFSVVVHGRMQDLQRGATIIGGGGHVGGFGACFPPKKIFNGATWCVLEHIFIIFLLSKSLKIILIQK